MLNKICQLQHGHICNFRNIFIAHSDSQRLFFKTTAAALITRSNGHKVLIFLLHHLRACLAVTPFHVFNEPVKSHVIYPLASLTAVMYLHFMAVRSVNQNILYIFRIVLERRGQLKVIFFGQCD